jgi:hypothetical protein
MKFYNCCVSIESSNIRIGLNDGLIYTTGCFSCYLTDSEYKCLRHNKTAHISVLEVYGRCIFGNKLKRIDYQGNGWWLRDRIEAIKYGGLKLYIDFCKANKTLASYNDIWNTTHGN